jgi:D-aminopeptidase
MVFSTSPELCTRFGDSAPGERQMLPPDAVSPLFRAVLEAAGEAVYNALFRATAVTARFVTAEAIPIECVRALLPWGAR